MHLFARKPSKRVNTETLRSILYLDPELAGDPQFCRIRFSKRKAAGVVALTLGIMLALLGAISLLGRFLQPAHTNSEGSNVQSPIQVRSNK